MTARQMIEEAQEKKPDWEAACKNEARQATMYRNRYMKSQRLSDRYLHCLQSLLDNPYDDDERKAALKLIGED